MSNCENPSLNPFTDLLNNLYDIVKTVMQYMGFVLTFAGSILWLTADGSSNRGQWGLSMFVGGLALVFLFFGMGSFISVLKGIAGGGPL